MAALNGGSTRAQVRHGFAYSSEFQGNVVRLCPVTSSSTSTSANLKYVLTDVQGSARVLMENNGTSSAILARHDYLPFGEEIWVGVSRTTSQKYATTDKVRQRFALTERDEASGLDHTWFRKYDSFAGRWTSPDPYGGSMSAGDPQSFNRYAYVQNDPVNHLDPSGLDPIGIPIGMPAPWGPIISGGGILPVPTGVVNIPIGGSGNGPSDGGAILGGMIGDTGILIETGGEQEPGGVGGGRQDRPADPPKTPPSKPKGDPNSPGCKALAQKIANIQADIITHISALIHNPNNLPENSPTGKIKDGVIEHRDRVLREADNLARRIQEYRDKCGGGNPPSVPSARPSRSWRSRSVNYPNGYELRSLAPIGIGIGAAGILCVVFLEVCIPVAAGGAIYAH
jgi:RHS repeat-associated protein